MKNIFDILSCDDEQGVYDGEIFCTKHVSSELEEALDKATDNLADATAKADLSWPIIIFQYICGLTSIILVASLFEVAVEMGIKILLEKWILVLAAVITGSIWGAIELLGKKKEKQVIESLENEHIWDEIDELDNKTAVEMDIPEDNMAVDVLGEIYEMKRGKRKSACQPITLNGSTTMYFREGYLCFFDGAQELSIPLREITNIEKRKKRMSIANWNKEEDYESSKYKKFYIVPNNYGLLIKEYYSIQIQSIWGEFEVRLPEYEEEAVNRIRENAKI